MTGHLRKTMLHVGIGVSIGIVLVATLGSQVAGATSLPALPAMPTLPSMPPPSLPNMSSLPALPSLPQASIPSPTASSGGSVQSWASYFANQYAMQSKTLNNTYSASSTAINFAKEWATIKTLGTTPLTTPSLGKIPSITTPSLPKESLSSPSTPGFPPLSPSTLTQIFGSAGGAMLPPPPGYSSIAINPIYLPSTIRSAFSSKLAAFGCSSLSNACLAQASQNGLNTLENEVFAKNSHGNQLNQLYAAISNRELQGLASKELPPVQSLIDQAQRTPTTPAQPATTATIKAARATATFMFWPAESIAKGLSALSHLHF